MKEMLSDADLGPIAELVLARTGLAFPHSRRQDLDIGASRTMAKAGVTDPGHFLQLLRSNTDMFDALIAAITVNETYFFREPTQFQTLRQHILPDLLRRLPANDTLRIWSAGCASGEEPYSLAILLDQECPGVQASILATDISRPALARARKAVYGAWSLRDDSLDIAARYFDNHRDHFTLHERFRRRVNFNYLNLVLETYPSPITQTVDLDLILCRNVLIYFEAETIQQIARRFFESLRQGGWLIAGPSDPPLWAHAPFRTIVTPNGIFYQRQAENDEGAADVIFKTTMERPSRPLDPPLSLPSLTDTHLPRHHAAMPAVGPGPRPADMVQTAPNDASHHIEKIRKHADSGELHEAQRQAAAALRAFPLNPEIHYLVAMIHMGSGNYGAAAESLRRVLYLDPSLAVAHFALGSALGRLGAVKEARRSFETVLKLCHDQPQDKPPLLSDGDPIHHLMAAARYQLSIISPAGEFPR